MVESTELARVRIATPGDVRSAALALRAAVERRLGDWRVAACSSIASARPMLDGEGQMLATTVFGWTERAEDG